MPVFNILVVPDDGEPVIVNAGRPACLMAFEEEFQHSTPEDYTETAWLAHRALKIETPLKEWIETLDELTANPVDIEKAKARKQGEEITDEEALERAAGAVNVPADVLRARLAGETDIPPTPAALSGGG